MKAKRSRRRLGPRSDWGNRSAGRGDRGEYEPNGQLVIDATRPPRPGPEVPPGPARAAATCASKQPYLSELLATNGAALIYLAGGRQTWPYLCPTCGDWHLTSTAPT